jgi:hypothetical protein
MGKVRVKREEGAEITNINKQEIKAGEYIDEYGKSWVTKYHLHKRTGISYPALSTLLGQVESSEHRVNGRRRVVFYREEEASACLEMMLNIPYANNESGRYIDSNGISWMPIGKFAEELGITKKTVSSQVENIPFIIGRVKSRQGMRLYNEAILLDKFANLALLPQVDKESNRYIKNDAEWVSYKFLSNEFGISYVQLNRLLQDCQGIQGRGKNGSVVTLYNLIEAKEILEAFLSLPKVDRKTGDYTSNSDEQWTTIKRLSQEYGIEEGSISSRMEGVQTIVGRNKINKKTVLFNKQQAVQEIEKFITRPRVDKETGLYKDANTEEWVARSFIQATYGIHYATQRPLLEGLRTIEGRDKLGQAAILYSLRDVLQEINRSSYVERKNQRKPKGYWTPEQIEKEALEFYQQEGGLSYYSLNVKNYPLGIAISRYPGKMSGLKEKLGIPLSTMGVKKPMEAESFAYAESQAIFDALTYERRQEIVDQFADFIEQNPETEISVLEFAKSYLNK